MLLLPDLTKKSNCEWLSSGKCDMLHKQLSYCMLNKVNIGDLENWKNQIADLLRVRSRKDMDKIRILVKVEKKS